MKTAGGTILLNDRQGSMEVRSRSAESPIVKIPGIDQKAWHLFVDLLNNGVEGQCKTQWAKRVPLLDSTAAEDGAATEVEERLCPITHLHRPSLTSWNMLPRSTLLKALEKSRRRVHLPSGGVAASSCTRATACTMASRPHGTPTPTWVGVRTLEASDRTAHEMHFEVRRRKISPTVMGRTPPSFLLAGEKGGSTEVRHNHGRDVASTHQVNYVQQG